MFFPSTLDEKPKTIQNDKNVPDVFLQPPVQCCAAVTASTPGGAVSATAAGKAPSVTFLRPSVLILSAGDMGSVLLETVRATQDTKEPTVNKVTWK